MDKRNARGINLGASPNRFKNEYWKYTSNGYPLSTIKSKKFTDLTVKAIIDKPKTMVRNVLKISIKKFW